MSNKKSQVVGTLLAVATGLAGHSVEPMEPKPGNLIATPVSHLVVAYLPEGHEPATGYTHTVQGVVAQVTTPSVPFIPWPDSFMPARRSPIPYYDGEVRNLCLNPPVG